MLRAEFSLRQYQEYVRQSEVERGFDKESPIEKCLHLGEEVGELFKAVRSASGLTVDPSSSVRDVAEELADVLNFVLAIANRFDIDLASSYMEKEAVNASRSWQSAKQDRT